MPVQATRMIHLSPDYGMIVSNAEGNPSVKITQNQLGSSSGPNMSPFSLGDPPGGDHEELPEPGGLRCAGRHGMRESGSSW